MAMLAEPRRKKRYNLCPRGKALYEDDSRFGTKMLEKMGWSKGRGLGANEDGSQEFVRVRFKNDAEGLGYEARDDQWTVHEEGFNGLLKALNGEENNENETNGGVGSASEDEARPMGFGFKPEPVVEQAKPKSLKENISGVSLEEKSKLSKARVHYTKFTRGKDLAQYSEKDLANIFGKKATEAIESPVQIIPEPEQVEEEKTLNPNFGGVQTVSTGLSVSDYFRMKMEAMKNKLKNNAINTGGEPKTVNEKDAQPDGIATAGAEEQPTKKKKKKKDRDLELELKDEPETVAVNANADEEQPAKKKKKKKDKEQNQELEQENDITEVTSLEQKKKKKSKRKSEDEPVQSEQSVVQCEEINPPKRKKKKNRQDDTNENVDTAEPTLPSEGKSVEPKKKKSKKSEDIVEEETEGTHFEEAEKPTKKKNKKNKENKEEPLAESEHIETESNSKRKSKVTHEAQKESSPVEISENPENKIKKKSKKNNKTLLVVEPQTDEPITKKKKNSSQKHESEVSVDDDSDSSAISENTDNYLTHEQLLAKLDSFNVYTTSSFCAEKFHLVDMKKFKNSSLPQISGYSIEENINLKIVETKYDANRIMSLWENRSNKYAKSKETYQKVNNYYKRINPTAIKAIRRTQAFTGI